MRNVFVLVAIGGSLGGHRQLLVTAERAKEDNAGWGGFVGYLKQRGHNRLRLAASNACMGLI